MEIIFLGTAGSIPTKERNLSAILIEYMNEYFLFDCGEGTQRQMRFADINFMRIDNIFITHLHADHFLGLGGLIQSMDFLERTRELNIYGPEGMKETMEHMLSMGTFILDSLRINVHEVSEGLVLKNERYKITCVKTEHTQNSLAYCFEESPKRKFLRSRAIELGIPEGRLFSKLQRGETIEFNGRRITPDQVLSDPIPGRKVVYTGDTRPSERIVEFARNADILIHDSTLSFEDLNTERKIDHSSAREAAEIAKKANVKKLYLTHISQRYPDATKLEAEAREVFPESYVAEDLMRVKIKKHDLNI
ncbi:MAG: ribonuclease Z [Candidatus Altiarchaeales archaeon]|nr:MAG: ribonuclease Z [Candidatus Altiarchaeales archaeon]RLI95189.1 MAG: ribonuclease Z [Candidatus Altiarchaeales archaeon]RLI95416.1 MAG: ribonuclease Z [Candidatus Altiarchaeales archaeon]